MLLYIFRSDHSNNESSPGLQDDFDSSSNLLINEISPDNNNEDEEHVQEQYVILGNVYTVTRPRTTSGSGTKTPKSAKISVSPALTQEDMHVFNEASCHVEPVTTTVHVSKLMDGVSNSLVTPLTPDSETDEFWTDLDVSTIESSTDDSMVYRIRKKENSSDIVRPGILPLKTVLE